MNRMRRTPEMIQYDDLQRCPGSGIFWIRVCLPISTWCRQSPNGLFSFGRALQKCYIKPRLVEHKTIINEDNA